MLLVKDKVALHAALKVFEATQKTIALVPTMGALHEGHLSLVRVAKEHADIVCMTIFVNPLQFNSPDDLTKYPRTLEEDIRLATEAKVDLLFCPSVEEVYPKSKKPVRIVAGSCSNGLCGSTRPGHFDGVVTVVAILFNLFKPHFAVFGEKDYQQLKVIEQLVADLHYDIKILPAPLLRESDGLALSSRNLRLSDAERIQALVISKTLFWARDIVKAGAVELVELKNCVTSKLQESGIKVDYVEIVDCDSLESVTSLLNPAQLAVAGFVGEVRLIDNICLGW